MEPSLWEEDYRMDGPDEPIDEDLYSLSETPEGQGLEHIDPRDLTPDPPAYLDPWWILRQRRRVQIFIETGMICWPKVAA